jgi:hypothetical protein
MGIDEQNLNDPMGYSTPDAKEYAQWLRAGISKFKK